MNYLSSEEYLVSFTRSHYWPDFLFINQYPILAVFWNIFLIFAAYGTYLILFKIYNRKTKSKNSIAKIFFWPLFFLWFLFAPNSAYIITDMRHISGYCPDTVLRICVENAWMIIFFFIYAVIGWVSFVFLVSRMRSLIEKIKNSGWGFVFEMTAIPLLALGIMLGLVDRWNSWDVFIFPKALFFDVLKYFTEVLSFRNWAIFTCGLYLLYFSGKYLFNFERYKKENFFHSKI